MKSFSQTFQQKSQYLCAKKFFWRKLSFYVFSYSDTFKQTSKNAARVTCDVFTFYSIGV